MMPIKKMKILHKKNITYISFLIILVYYAGISFSIEFLHNSHEDPTKYHDNCPACNWERQLQDTSQTISSAQVCEQIHQTFVRFLLIPEECLNFHSIILANPLSRAPPVA